MGHLKKLQQSRLLWFVRVGQIGENDMGKSKGKRSRELRDNGQAKCHEGTRKTETEMERYI